MAGGLAPGGEPVPIWIEHQDAVRPEWLDGNGHMNLAYYVLVFDRGTDAWLDAVDLGAAYRARTGCSVFAVETHTIYRQEAGLGAALTVRTAAAGAAGRKLHLIHEMTSAGETLAMQEILFLHVDLATRRSVAMPAEQAARAAAMVLAPPLPGWLGRCVARL